MATPTRDEQIAALTARVAALEAQNAELVAATLPIARQAVLVRTKDGDRTVVPIWVQAGQVRRCWRAVEAVEPTALPQPRDERRVG